MPINTTNGLTPLLPYSLETKEIQPSSKKASNSQQQQQTLPPCRDLMPILRSQRHHQTQHQRTQQQQTTQQQRTQEQQNILHTQELNHSVSEDEYFPLNKSVHSPTNQQPNSIPTTHQNASTSIASLLGNLYQEASAIILDNQNKLARLEILLAQNELPCINASTLLSNRTTNSLSNTLHSHHPHTTASSQTEQLKQAIQNNLDSLWTLISKLWIIRQSLMTDKSTPSSDSSMDSTSESNQLERDIQRNIAVNMSKKFSGLLTAQIQQYHTIQEGHLERLEAQRKNSLLNKLHPKWPLQEASTESQASKTGSSDQSQQQLQQQQHNSHKHSVQGNGIQGFTATPPIVMATSPCPPLEQDSLDGPDSDIYELIPNQLRLHDNTLRQETQQIIKSMTELSELFRRVQCLIMQQAGIVDAIHEHLTSTAQSVSKGKAHLSKAQKFQGKWKSLAIALVIVVLLALALSVFVFLGKDGKPMSQLKWKPLV